LNKLLKKIRGLTDAEEMLTDMNISFMRNDGTTVVLGDVYLCGRGLEKLPDFSSLVVQGNFYCNGNRLKTLEGAPMRVTGIFECHDNQLENLAGAPARFRRLVSDFGRFSGRSNIPNDLYPIEETKVTTLGKALTVRKPLTLKLPV
jgi:hypothetical protein